MASGLIKYIDYLSDINDPTKYRKFSKEKYIIPFTSVIFIANRRELQLTLHEYYMQILDLQDARDITAEMIRSAYRHKAYIAIQHNIDLPLHDIDAARNYLLDQWEYLTRFN